MTSKLFQESYKCIGIVASKTTFSVAPASIDLLSELFPVLNWESKVPLSVHNLTSRGSPFKRLKSIARKGEV